MASILGSAINSNYLELRPRRIAAATLAPVVAALSTIALQPGHAVAKEVYKEPTEFLASVFDGDQPDAEAMWLSGNTRDTAEAILGHAYNGARIRYWQRDDKTAWILEEIGKHEPITTGYVVEGGEIERVKVLIYRESRGWEVRQDFFVEQFEGATLTGEGYELDRSIHGISGATLSVRALTKLARLALYLHGRAVEAG